VKLPRPTREQRRLAETLLPLLQEAEHALDQGQPARALTVLQGAAPEPPPYLSPYDQLRWHWLAGAALLAVHRCAEARDWLMRGMALAGRLRPYVLAKQEQGFDALTERVLTSWAAIISKRASLGRRCSCIASACLLSTAADSPIKPSRC
jgi:hypothetical protein